MSHQRMWLQYTALHTAVSCTQRDQPDIVPQTTPSFPLFSPWYFIWYSYRCAGGMDFTLPKPA